MVGPAVLVVHNDTRVSHCRGSITHIHMLLVSIRPNTPVNILTIKDLQQPPTPEVDLLVLLKDNSDLIHRWDRLWRMID